jgi:hypothetical protein
VLKDVAWVTRALRGTHTGDVETLLSSTAEITSTLAHNSAQLADLVTGLNITSSALASADGALAQSISGLDQTLQASPAALSAIDASLPPLANLATTLDPSLKAAPKLVDGLTQTLGQLGAVVAPAERNRLLASLNAAFQQLPSVLTKLGAVFPITKSVTDCLSTHVKPILNRVVPDGALTTHQPVWQEFVHFLGGLASSGQNFDANGHWIRLQSGVGTNTISLGNIPIVGQLLGTAPSGGSAIQGASPHWVGDLQPSAYQPGVPCTSQAVPSLASLGTAAHTARSTSPAPGTWSIGLSCGPTWSARSSLRATDEPTHGPADQALRALVPDPDRADDRRHRVRLLHPAPAAAPEPVPDLLRGRRGLPDRRGRGAGSGRAGQRGRRPPGSDHRHLAAQRTGGHPHGDRSQQDAAAVPQRGSRPGAQHPAHGHAGRHLPRQPVGRRAAARSDDPDRPDHLADRLR